MHRRTLLSVALLLTFAAPLTAHADLAPPPPPLVAITGERSMITTASGAPTQAWFTFESHAQVPAEVRLESVVVLLDGMRLPLRIVAARIEGRDVGRTFTLAPGQRARVELQLDGFSEPAMRASAWDIELAATVRDGRFGGHVRGVAQVRRGIRHPLPPG